MNYNTDKVVTIKHIAATDKVMIQTNFDKIATNVTISPVLNYKNIYDTGLDDKDIKYLKSIGYNEEILPTPIPGVRAHPFWESSKVELQLTQDDLSLYPYENPLDYIKWKYALVSRFIYRNYEEMLLGEKLEARHYISDEHEENAHRAAKILGNQELNRKVFKLSAKDKKQIVTIINREDVSSQSEDYIVVQMDEIVQNSKVRLRELLTHTSDKLRVIATVILGRIKGVIHEQVDGLYFKANMLGDTEESAINKLLDNRNQNLLLTIEKAFKS